MQGQTQSARNRALDEPLQISCSDWEAESALGRKGGDARTSLKPVEESTLAHQASRTPGRLVTWPRYLRE